jgi:hypothetical protein
MNKKEEVIHIELTQYGKYKLSRGKFHPYQYAFFDDDILYDGLYGGVEEEPREVQGRIDETPQRRTQYCFTSLEKQVKQLTSLIRNEKLELTDDELQNYKEREYVFPAPIGSSEIKNDKYPAWQINFLKGEVEAIASYLTLQEQVVKIAQVDMEPVIYETQVLLRGTEEDTSADSPATSVDELDFPDGSYVEVYGDCLLFSVDEFNTEFENENFHMEVFIVEEQRVIENGQAVLKEVLIPLSFVKKKGSSNIVNGILMDDEPKNAISFSDTELDSSFVEYWFDVACDYEIDRNVLCSNLAPKVIRGDVLRQDDYDCPDLPRYEDRLTERTEDIRLVPLKGDDC